MADFDAAAFGVFCDLDDEETGTIPRLTSTDLTDDNLKRYTRLSRELFDHLLELLRPNLERNTERNNALSSDTQLLLACSFFASGGFQWLVGSSCHLSQPTASRIITTVVNALCEIAPSYIKLPLTEQERLDTKQGFYSVAKFPNVIGAVDGTHIQIIKPSKTLNPQQYMNRKCKYTINAQITCTATLKVIDVLADYPGSNHDAYIWSLSSLRKVITSGLIPDGVLIADSGYPLEPWLMTPIERPQSDAEERYNSSQRRTRSIVERCIGVIKSRFRCVDQTGGALCYSPTMAGKIFTAVCVLHNMCLDFALSDVDVDDTVLANHREDQIDLVSRLAVDGAAAEVRSNVVANHFT